MAKRGRRAHSDYVRRLIAGGVVAGFLALSCVSTAGASGDGQARASASPLTIGQAKSAVGSYLIEDFKYGAKRGSLLAFCSKRGRYLVSCDILFTDLDGDAWCGHAGVRAFGSGKRKLKIRTSVSTRDCGLF